MPSHRRRRGQLAARRGAPRPGGRSGDAPQAPGAPRGDGAPAQWGQTGVAAVTTARGGRGAGVRGTGGRSAHPPRRAHCPACSLHRGARRSRLVSPVTPAPAAAQVPEPTPGSTAAGPGPARGARGAATAGTPRPLRAQLRSPRRTLCRSALQGPPRALPARSPSGGRISLTGAETPAALGARPELGRGRGRPRRAPAPPPRPLPPAPRAARTARSSPRARAPPLTLPPPPALSSRPLAAPAVTFAPQPVPLQLIGGGAGDVGPEGASLRRERRRDGRRRRECRKRLLGAEAGRGPAGRGGPSLASRGGGRAGRPACCGRRAQGPAPGCDLRSSRRRRRSAEGLRVPAGAGAGGEPSRLFRSGRSCAQSASPVLPA